MSISDPLTLLREFTIAKKAITLEGDHIVFGRTRFPRGAATAYRAGSGKKDYYSIDSVWGLLEKGGDKAAEYAKWCGAQGITVIAFLDRKNLLSYLRGEGDGSSANVDYAGVPQVKPVDEAGASMDVAMADGAEAASLPSALKPSRKREPTAEEAKAIEEAKEAFKQVLVKPIGAPIPDKPAAADEPAATDGPSADVAMGEAADEGGSAEPAAGDKGGKKKAKAGEGKAAADPAAAAAKHSMDGLKEAIALAKPFIRSDRELSSAIVKRERQMRSRSSSLLAPHAKSFPVLTAILDGFKKRNKAVMDLKDREARKSSKSGGGPSSAAAASSAAASSRSAASSSIPPLPAHLAAPKPKPSASSSSVPRPAPKGGGATGGKSGVGILVVPAAITAIVNMYNARKLLENDEYTPGAELKNAGAPKETSIKLSHTFDDGSSVSLIVIDNPTTRLSQAEWGNVVGVIAQGTSWQFKGWPYAKGETEIFSKVVGYYMRYSDEIPNQLTKGWAVTNLIFSKERSRKHEVSSMMMEFWQKMHKYLLVTKPQLLHRPHK